MRNAIERTIVEAFLELEADEVHEIVMAPYLELRESLLSQAA